MSAAIVPFTPADEKDQKTLEGFRAFHAAYWEMQALAGKAGWGTDGASPVSRMFHAGCRYAAVWERRAARLGRQLQAILASDTLSDPQRGDIVKALTGCTRRDAKLLTASERALLDDIRALSGPDAVAVKRFVRTLATAARVEKGTGA